MFSRRRATLQYLAAAALALSALNVRAQDDLDDLLGTQPPAAEPTPAPAATSSRTPSASPAPDHQQPPLEVIELPRHEPPPAKPSGQRRQIEEIVVTAQKRDQNLQDVPIAITAMSADEIADRQIHDLGDLASQMSSFHFGEVAGGGQASIRGVGFSLVSGVGEGSVAIHSDGLFLSRPGSATMLQTDLAGIEVLRGPQGTLYGRNATAGVVNLISPAPPEEFEMSLAAGAGNFDARRYSGNVGGGMLDRKLRMRLSASRDERGDFLKNEMFPGRDQGGSDQLGFRLGIDLDATDWLSMKLRAFSAEQDLNGPYYPVQNAPSDSLLAPPGTYSTDPYRIRTNDDGFSTKTLRGGSLKLIFALGDQYSLTSQTGYAKYGFVSPGYDGDGTSNDLFTTKRVEASWTATEELNLSYNGERWQWLAGAFFMKESNSLDFDVLTSAGGVAGLALSQILGGTDTSALTELVDILGPNAEININNETMPKTRSYAVFGDATVNLLDDLRLYFGLRYLNDHMEQVQDSGIVANADDSVGVISCEDLYTEIDNSAVKGRLGLQYDLSEATMLYGQFSNGFKSGGFGVGACGNTFEPEELDAFEVGFKTTLFDRTVRWNAAAFYYDYHNLQVEQVNLPQLLVENAQAEVKGMETDLTWLATDALEFSIGATFLHARYTEFVNSDSTQAIVGAPDQDLRGNTLNRSPDFSGTFSTQYTWQLHRAGALSLRGQVDYSTRTYLREFNLATDSQPPTALYNAFVNWSSPDQTWTLRAFGKNLSDEPVLIGLLGIGGYKGSVFNIGRTFGLDLSYAFGR